MNSELKKMVAKARKAGACQWHLGIIERYKTLAEALANQDGPFWCYWYAHWVLRRRWRRAEAVIKKSKCLFDAYTEDVIKWNKQKGQKRRKK